METASHIGAKAAIMLTDMVGYTSLTQKNGPLALELMEECRDIIRNAVSAHGGREIKTIGDATLIEFDHASAAVLCGVDVQCAVAERNSTSPPGMTIRLRIGVHLGPVVHRDGDVYGAGVNIAARVEPLARPGHVCITEDVRVQLGDDLGVPITPLGPHRLHGVDEPMEIYEVHGATPTAELSRPDPETEARTSVAVLPFVNLSGSPSDEYFSDGMTDELIAVLSRQRGLRVISRTSAFSVKDSGLGARAIARLLNVQTILEGSVRKSNGRVRLSARLVRAEDEVQLWSETFDRELDDVFAIQEEIAQAIARALQVELLGGATRYGDVATRDMAAYTLYLKGRYCWAQRSERSLKRAVAYFRRAIEVNSSYALAYSGLADALTVLPDYAAFPREEAHRRALEAAQKALSLDDELAEAYASLADVKLLYEWDWRGAEQGFQRAIRLRPGYGTAYHWYAHCLLYTGRFEEAYVWLEQALELDPLSVIAHANRGLALYALGDHRRALAALHQATALAPEFGIAEVYLGLVHCALGQFEEARTHFSSAKAHLGQKSVLAEIGCAVVEAATEGHDSARHRMEQVRERHQAYEPFCIAAGYAGIGDGRAAFRWLEEALRRRDTMLRFIQVLHLFDTLRDDPCYREILDRMGLLSAAPPA